MKCDAEHSLANMCSCTANNSSALTAVPRPRRRVSSMPRARRLPPHAVAGIASPRKPSPWTSDAEGASRCSRRASPTDPTPAALANPAAGIALRPSGLTLGRMRSVRRSSSEARVEAREPSRRRPRRLLCAAATSATGPSRRVGSPCSSCSPNAGPRFFSADRRFKQLETRPKEKKEGAKRLSVELEREVADLAQDVRSRYWEKKRNQQMVANGMFQLYTPHPRMRRNSWCSFKHNTTRARALIRVIQ